ncbi:MAG: hypothetical protein RLY20_197 [Verrucomicrobiota bacterium]|jgi:hypothetical protein
MKQHKQTSRERELLSHTQAQQTSAREFNSAEEALREDIRQTVVPATVEQRLSESISKLPKPGKPWWKRLIS